MNEMGKFYKPIIKDNIQIDGFDAQLIPDGETGLIIQKLFITSLEENFNIYADKILSIFNIQNPGSHINDTLIIIKSDNNAYFYNRFPFSIECITKRDMINNHAVFKRDLIDITSISFKDSFTDLNPLDGDQFIWIFRVNWIFGLYFDLSKTLKQDNLLIELGFHYKRLSYISVYDFIENESYFKTMINDGWFPFISLISHKS